MLNGLTKLIGFVRFERIGRARLGLVGKIKGNVVTGMAKRMTTQVLSNGLIQRHIELAVVFLVLGVGSAVRETVVAVGFLGIGVWADLSIIVYDTVYCEIYWLLILHH